MARLGKQFEVAWDVDRSQAVAFLRQRLSVALQVSCVEMLQRLVRKADAEDQGDLDSRVQIEDLDVIRGV